MPEHVVGRVVEQLNDRGVPLPEADVLVVGAAYKPDVSDTRESPAVDIVDGLEKWHADVEYHDPHVPALSVGERTYESVPLTDDRIEAADCIVLVTDHSALDIGRLAERSSLLFDTRNAAAGIEADGVVRL